MKVMSLCVEKQIEPRINHSLKLNSGLMRQIEELKTATEKIEESHKAEMANKVQEWEFCKNQISEVLEKSTEILQHFDQIAAENEQENMKIGPLKTGLSEAQEAIRKIEYMSGSITQLTSEIEAQNDVVKNLHNNAEMTQIKMESSLARIEQFKFDWDVAEAQKSFLSKRLDEIHRLVICFFFVDIFYRLQRIIKFFLSLQYRWILLAPRLKLLKWRAIPFSIVKSCNDHISWNTKKN